MRKILIMIFIISFITACSTYRTGIPSISGSSRKIQLKTPIFISVLDGRAKPDEKAAEILHENLFSIYDGALECVDYFSKIPNGRVGVKIRIIELGSNFGSRIISSVAYSNSIAQTSATVTDLWSPVFVTATSNQSIFSEAFTGEGWWIGTAWLDVTIEDRRLETPSLFTVPIAAEQKKTNMWGYASGDKAVENAWNKVSPQLLKMLDQVLFVVRDGESQ